MEYIQIAETEGKESIDMPSEDDGTLLLSTVTNLYPDAIGLKYIVNGRPRVLRLANEKLYPPPGGWGDNLYLCILKDLKRQREKEGESVVGSNNKSDTNANSGTFKRFKEAEHDDQYVQNHDLIVKDLGYDMTDKKLVDYFSIFGKLKYAKVVMDNISGSSKGYAFIRFSDEKVKEKVLSMKHSINNRFVKIERSVNKVLPKDHLFCQVNSENVMSRKVFVGNLNDGITRDMLVAYFSKFGNVTQVYMPGGSKGYAFVTFEEEESVLTVLKYPEHKINHHKIRVGKAQVSKKSDNNVEQANAAPTTELVYPSPGARSNYFGGPSAYSMYRGMFMPSYNTPFFPGMQAWANQPRWFGRGCSHGR